MNRSFLLIFLLITLSCSKRPIPTSIDDGFDQTVLEQPNALQVAGGLWLALSDFKMTGRLVRIELRKDNPEFGKIKRLGRVGYDTKLFPKNDQQIFVLMSGTSETIQVREGIRGTLVAEQGLGDCPNPYHAIEDRLKQVWLVCYRSNKVRVFSQNLEQLKAVIDAPVEFKDQDPFMELGLIKEMPGDDKIMVVAQRLHRQTTGINWVPEPESGVFVVDRRNYRPISKQKIGVPNLSHIYLENDELLLLGAGDLSYETNEGGQIIRLSKDLQIELASTQLNSRIIQARFTHSSELIYLSWDKDNSESCLFRNNLKLICEKDDLDGYVFHKMEVVGQVVYVSYYRAPKLMAYNLETGQIQVIKTRMIVGSMSAGP